MQLALYYCGKEWRAQRSVLVAYSVLVFTSLCLGFLLMPPSWWGGWEPGQRGFVHGWFVAAGALVVVAFVAPALVRGEFGAKDDQFVRRLPGALLPAFGGKMMFLLLCALGLPLVGFACGELFLQAIGQPWRNTFLWRHDGTYEFCWPWPALLGGAALLLAPWVWAIGTWLPRGRMAIGGTGLLVLLLGVGVAAVLRQSPGLEQGIAWQGWLWAIAPLGLLVAGVSWVKGRCGGGLRSARFGFAAMVVGLLPPGVWLGSEAQRFHHPDPSRLSTLYISGISPDLHFALAYGAEHQQWSLVPLRIDLQGGMVEELAGIHSVFTPELVPPSLLRQGGALRYWRSFGEDCRAQRVLDLATGTWTTIGYEEVANAAVLPTDLRAKVLDEVRATTPLRAPGNRRVWCVDGELCAERPDGSVVRRPWSRRERFMDSAGHGISVRGPEGGFFDLNGNQIAAAKQDRWLAAFCVRDHWVFVPRPKSLGYWYQLDPNGESAVCEPLHGATVLGLFDDDHLLCHLVATKVRPGRLFLYRPADRVVLELVVPAEVPLRWVQARWPLHVPASLLTRDPAGRIWLSGYADSGSQEVWMTLDTNMRALSLCTWWQRLGPARFVLLGWPDAHRVIMQDDTQVVGIEVETGVRTVLFPRR
ncbi:MAG: hypothetical protein ABIP94_22060 [Planctomycetota bacterium]